MRFALIVLAVFAAAVPGAAAVSRSASKPATSVPKPSGKAPLRYRDVVFPDVSVARDIVYGTAPDLAGNPVSLTLDIYTPQGDRAKGRPAMVWIHGGGFRTGDKSQEMTRLATAFAQRGYVAISINYRLLNPKGKCVDQPGACQIPAVAAQHDAQAAVRWLRTDATRLRIDPRRIAVGGGSAGAATALLLATRASDPGDSGNPGPSSAVQGAVSISGVLPNNEVPYSRRDAPALFFNGTADTTVPYAGAKATADAMAKAGVPVVFETLKGAGHVPFAQYRNRFIVDSASFLYEHLGLGNS